jgi:hypothetical protein
MPYGVNFAELHRRAADFVDKILKGATPAGPNGVGEPLERRQRLTPGHRDLNKSTRTFRANAGADRDHAMIQPDDATPKSDEIFGKDKDRGGYAIGGAVARQDCCQNALTFNSIGNSFL